jgi:cellulose synthase (UDP-forming)
LTPDHPSPHAPAPAVGSAPAALTTASEDRFRGRAQPTPALSRIVAQGKEQSPSLGAIFYLAFLLNPSHVGDPLPFVIVVVCETVLVVQALLTMWTALSSTHDPRDARFHEARQRLYGSPSEGIPIGEDLYLDRRKTSVDVFITTYGEDPKIIEGTLRAARDMRGVHGTYVLDDGESPEVRESARRLGVH